MSPNIHRDTKKWRGVTLLVIGAILGLAVWMLAYLVTAQYSAFPIWVQESSVFLTIHDACVIISAPVAMLGWLFVWGDHGPPYVWMQSGTFVTVTGLGMAAGIGALIGLGVSGAGKICQQFGSA